MENPRNTPRLETPRLILRRFVPEDAPALWELLRDREVNRFLPWFPVETLAEAEKFLRERFLDTYRTETGWRRFLCAGKMASGSGLSGGLCGTGEPGEGL